MPVSLGDAQGTSSAVTSPTHTNHAQRGLQLTSSEALRAAIVNALTGVTLEGVLISWASETQAEVTLLKATIATESSSTLASAISNSEFVRSLSNELSKSVSLTAVPKISTVLVYPPSPPPPRPADPGGSVLPPLNNVTGPTLTVTRTAINQAMGFLWDQHAGRRSCCMGAGLHYCMLGCRCCRRSAQRPYQQLTSDATSSHLLYPSIQLAVVRVDSAFPTLAPAVSACDGHAITMVGAGFSRLPASSYCNFETVVATLLNSTHGQCVKPAVSNAPAGTRVQPLRVSATGQCFSNGAAEFTTYTAQVVSLSVTGAPYSTPVRLHIYGTGFPIASGSSCWFTNGTATLRTPATVDSSTQATCWSPSVAYPGRYRVYLSLNGLQVEPSLYTTPTFDAYDLAAVRVTQLVPPAVPLETSTALTIHGSGFAEYGSRFNSSSRQLVCKVGIQLISASMLDRSHIMCPLPAIAATGELSVSISLNGGADGTFAADERTLLAYAPPKITSITPSGGDAQGGEVVTISGSGFSATSASNVRCSFGGTLQLTKPTTVTDTQVVCLSTWGDESELGSSVGVSLNDGVSLHESSAIRFKYSGVYRPQLVDAFFSQDATKLLMQFASAETNQAGVSGKVNCRRFLDSSTVRSLRGSSVSEPECIWVSATTVVAFLAVGTAAAPGMRIAFLPGTIWPKSWNYPGSCSVPNAKCNTVSSTELP
ncbi:hypothetical protein AB1Y20_004561 [Prymnesium parvum]|uniref:IPT/TIG domain-containing protein n=1 Tax=Prymnesium parvum TaxID=97485 RepID=A0AB34IZL4_PRYPA